MKQNVLSLENEVYLKTSSPWRERQKTTNPPKEKTFTETQVAEMLKSLHRQTIDKAWEWIERELMPYTGLDDSLAEESFYKAMEE